MMFGGLTSVGMPGASGRGSDPDFEPNTKIPSSHSLKHTTHTQGNPCYVTQQVSNYTVTSKLLYVFIESLNECYHSQNCITILILALEKAKTQIDKKS